MIQGTAVTFKDRLSDIWSLIVPIQWFPGHMTKAFKQIKESLLKTDVVIEILDARIPHASRNPMIEEIVADKPSVVVLNKSDLGDPEVMTRWVDYLKGGK